jgi:hypothetical protein
VFARSLPQAAVLGWGDSEIGVVSVASAHAAYVHAADWAFGSRCRSVLQPLTARADLSVLTAVDIQSFEQKPLPALATLPARVHTVAFLFTDGDNIQWFVNAFATDPDWFGRWAACESGVHATRQRAELIFAAAR